MAKIKSNTEKIVLSVLEGIRERKGFDIAVLDLRNVKNAVADYFIICSGGSDVQVKAIADSVVNQLKEDLEERPYHVEGAKIGEWVLVDYVDVVVHVFQKAPRAFYDLESLWGDAEIKRYEI